MANHKQKKLLTKNQLDRLAASFRKTNGGKVDGIVRFQCVVSWCESVVMQASLLEAVLDGMLDINWQNDEPTFVDASK